MDTQVYREAVNACAPLLEEDDLSSGEPVDTFTSRKRYMKHDLKICFVLINDRWLDNKRLALFCAANVIGCSSHK